MLLVGSQAMRYWDSNWAKDRLDAVQDYDLICTKEEFKTLVLSVAKLHRLVELNYVQGTNKAVAKFKVDGKLTVIDASLIDVQGGLQESDKQIHDFIYHANELVFDIMGVPIELNIASVQINFIMKLSHRYLKNSVHFNKTMNDLNEFKKTFGFHNLESLADYVGIWDQFQDILELRERLTYTYKHPKLNQNKKQFFTDSVPYKYDHDSIHRAVQHLSRPAYTYYMKDGAEVQTCKAKFFGTHECIRLYGVLEEAYVLALERAVIPHGTDPDRAFKIALEKVCTSITSGWFREYAYDNYDKVLALYHHSYVEKFKKALDLGEIAPYRA